MEKRAPTAKSAVACPDERASAARWIGFEPHTPFFVTDNRGIHGAGACCAKWAVPGARFRAVGVYGSVVGQAQLVGGEVYAPTHCVELRFKLLAGTAGAGLYVSNTGAWQPPKQSARWVPSASERKSFARFMADATQILAEDVPPQIQNNPLPLRQRVLYFQLDRRRYEPDGHIEHYAVAGGRLLVVAQLESKGRWVATHLETSITNNGLNVIRAYRPLAVFDVDGDGVPEVIFHSNAGDAWEDALLHIDDNGRNWRVVARSVFGSRA